MITANNIFVKLNGTSILEDITLEIPTGKLSVVLGQNGAGKSTLLRAICGDINPVEGTIIYHQTQLNAFDENQLARSRAIVLQNLRLSFSFSALEVVLMGRIPHTSNFETSRDHSIAVQCMELMGIAHLQNRDYPSLSGGEKQRVQLARAIAQIWEGIEDNQPCYLLLDEPTSSLDIAHQHQLLSLLSELSHKGVTVFLILHDLNLAAQYADVITLLKEGKQLATGSPDDIFEPELIKHAFECPVHIMKNPYSNCPLVVSERRQYIHSAKNSGNAFIR